MRATVQTVLLSQSRNTGTVTSGVFPCLASESVALVVQVSSGSGTVVAQALTGTDDTDLAPAGSPSGNLTAAGTAAAVLPINEVTGLGGVYGVRLTITSAAATCRVIAVVRE